MVMTTRPLSMRTRYIGPVGYAGAKIRATCAGRQVSVSYDYSATQQERHHAAALKLAARLGVTADSLHYVGQDPARPECRLWTITL